MHIILQKKFKLLNNFDAKNSKKFLAKKDKCLEHGIKVLYYSNLGIEYPYEVFEDKNKLLQKIIGNE